MSKFLLCIFLIFTTSLIWCQSMQQKLESQKKQIRKDIINNEKMLKAVKSKEKSALNVYSLKKNKIKLQEKLITTNENQTKLLIKDIENNEIKIEKLGNDLKVLKSDYAKKIVQSHKSKSESSRMVFLLSSSSFLQAYKRIQYLKQYTNYRRSQGVEIKNKSIALVESNNLLNEQKAVKVKLIEQNKVQRLALLEEKAKQEKLVVLIKKDKKNIIADILKKEAESKRIDKLVDKLIRQAIAESNRKAAAERARLLANAKALAVAKAKAKEKAAADAAAAAAASRANAVASSSSSPTVLPKKTVYVAPKPKYVEPAPAPVERVAVSDTKIDLTPELKAAELRFFASKGKLIWPVENGVISDNYGKHRHEVVNTLETYNSGIEITTVEGSNARAVFDGVVYNVLELSPISKVVMIQHGDFVTVYQNLRTLVVRVGDIVSEKQNLGLIRTSGESGKTVLKFLLLKNTVYENPSLWLAPK